MKEISLKKYSKVMPFFVITTRAKTARHSWRFIVTILNDFFFLQLAQKFHFTHRPLLNVGTELDDRIPFSPAHVNDYMDFVPYFIRPISMMIKEMGYKKAAPYINEFLDMLSKIYKNASYVYRRCMTTTVRPLYLKNPKFRAIHFFDSHLLCVPSIHVGIASGVYTFFRHKFQDEEFDIPKEKCDKLLADIKKQSILIIESVLFVKQHSVNCVPVAFYMLSSIFSPDFFAPRDAVEIINLLFVDNKEIDDECRTEVIAHFNYMYERVFLESLYSENWRECIFRWMNDWAKQTGQNISIDITP